MKKFGNFLLDSFLIEKELNEGLSIRSLEAYLSIFVLLMDNMYVVPSDLSTFTVGNFKMLLAETFTDRKWSSSTYNSYRKYFRVFCEYLKTEKYIIENPLDLVKKRKTDATLPKTLKKDQLEELKESLTRAFDNKTFLGLRNETLVYTFLYTGLRKTELLNLKITDLDLSEGFLKVIKGKGSKDRIIPLVDNVRKILFVYLKQRNKCVLKPSDYLFPTNFGGCLKNRDMRDIINRIRYCTTFHFTWHQLRHTFATELVRNNFDIYNISQILGHSKIETTKIYLSIDPIKLQKQMNQVTLFL